MEFYLLEKPINLNSLGRKGQSRLLDRQISMRGIYNLHGGYKYNYNFVDGSVKNLSIYAGVGSGNINNPRDMDQRRQRLILTI